MLMLGVPPMQVVTYLYGVGDGIRTHDVLLRKVTASHAVTSSPILGILSDCTRKSLIR